MSDPFRSQIRAALQNPGLQAALDGNADRRRKAWTAAFALLPESRDALRARAHAVRADVIANLEPYLEQFIERVQANGVQVHRAANPAEAIQAVLDILDSHGATLAVKSKSMVSEEVRLNQALEAHGVRAVETDLGEYIVQLRGEPPAHITTPAVHLSRAQVAQTFVDKLGVEYTEDIPTLTAIARSVLRRDFLEAQVGISGVNFGVVESGTLCLVTNEGNGRMCTTVPPVHIAMMGIERLVPTLDDLALMLKMLPRSATGQKLTVYTSLIQSPRQPGELDGPSERHLLLLDNGRKALSVSPLHEALFCIRCGACLNACPVFREIGGHSYRGVTGQATAYPGPIGSVISPGLLGIAEFGNLPRATSLCGACKDACPVDIDLPKMLLRLRAAGADMRTGMAAVQAAGASPASQYPAGRMRSHVPAGLRIGLQLYTWAARSPQRFAFIQRFGAALGRLAPWLHGWLRLPAMTGWGVSRDFPLPQRPFRDRFAAMAPARPRPAAGTAAGSTPGDNGRPVDLRSLPVDRPKQDLAEQFCAELHALGGQARRCSAADLPGAILQALRSRDIDAIQAWDEACFPAGLFPALHAGGVRIQREPDAALRAGLTGAEAAIAETGSLALTGAPGRPLTASLLPEVHLAVLRAADIMPALPEALRMLGMRSSSASVLISGPSRTADIEMTLSIGVHGPREVLVFVI